MKKVIAVLALVLAAGAALFLLTRPPEPFDPAELTPAETADSYPDTELSLEISGRQVALTFANHSGARLDTGAAVGADRERFFFGGLDVFLDGRWYQVPKEDMASVGVRLELKPGDSVSGAYSFAGYGDLPDGRYRISLGYRVFDPASDRPISEGPYYESYAEFLVADGRYALPAE